VTVIEGTVAAGFERVRDAFADAQARDSGGAQLCIYRGGKIVVDLAAGHDTVNARAYERSTLTVLMSCTKAVVAICSHLLVQRGQLDLDAPVSRYWREFARNGKADLRVNQLLSHSAGLMSFDPDSDITAVEMLDWDACTASLAEMTPLWDPSSAYLYHFITYGFLLGEVIRRISGRSVGAFLADEISRPLGLDLWIGLPQHAEGRVAPHFRSTDAVDAAVWRERFATLGFDTNQRLVRAVVRALTTTDDLIDLMTQRRGRAAEIPAGNGIGNARSLARLYAACIGSIDGVRLLSTATVDRARAPQTDGLRGPPPLDRLSDGSPQRFGLGFELPRQIMPMLGEGSFGHPGAGGRLGFADPESGIAVGYACNQLLWDGLTTDPRWSWCSALRDVVG
jgi:CubicO group peptidase (beta-lactamase class C family)